MTTKTAPSLVEFLTARIAEDEAIARAATPGPWEWWNLEGVDQGWTGNGPTLQRVTDEWKACEYGCTWAEPDANHRGERGKPGHEHRVVTSVVNSWGHDAWGISVSPDDAAHIARHDPARVLRECEAKRALVEHVCRVEWGGYAVRDVILEDIAAVYSDHPDYDPAWGVTR